MHTRILSVFNLLKRVGFVFLLVVYGVGYCAWDTDPQNPTFLWDTSTDPTIVSDGFGGAFFAFSILGNYWPHIGHVNAQGEQTFPVGVHPYENLLPVDEPQYAGTPIGTTLVQSGPPGTVIAVHERGVNGQYGGFVFSQFNTSGPSGFGSVGYIGQDYRLLSLQADDDHGWATIAGDLDGGVHFLMLGPQVNGQPMKYYNHINSQGQFTHEWPGHLIPRTRWAPYLVGDGYGGAMLIELEFPQNQLDSLWGQRYDSNGEPQWGQNGRMIHGTAENVWAKFDLLSPSKFIFWGREEVAEDSFVHYGYCIDTSGALVWGEDGITFECDGSEIIDLEPDQGGGFFYSGYIAGYGYCCHYNSDGNLIATAPWYSLFAEYPDIFGGGFNEYLGDDFGPLDTTKITHDRFNSDLIYVWDFTPAVIDVPSWYMGHVTVPDQWGGLIGLVSTSFGIAFYHLNPDGSIGPNLGVAQQPEGMPSNFLLSVFPNPFNSTLSISLDVPLHQEVTLSLYDLLGREVDVVYRGRLASSTISYVAPAALSSGVYFLRAASGERSELVKVVLLK